MVFQCEGLFTFAALIWSLRTMQKEMSVKTVFVRETFATMHTNVGPLASVDPRVCGKMMFEEKRLAALGTGVGPLLGNAHLASHVLLRLDFSLDLRSVDVGENVPKVGRGVGLTSRYVVGVGLIRGGCCPLHQDLIALFRRQLERSERSHEMLAHRVLVCCGKN